MLLKRPQFRAVNPIAAMVLAMSFVASCSAEESPQTYQCCRTQEVTYANGDVNLAGVLLSPTKSGQFPAAVIIQGAGDSSRANAWARSVAELFATHGISVLLTDKRGTGASGGDWRTSSFEDLAKDSIAGVEALRQVDGVIDDAVGIIGLSQGGHVAPLVPSFGDVAFVVNFVGGALDMKSTLFHELEQTYRKVGLGEADIDFLQEMTRLSFAYLETGEGFDEYLAYRDRVTERFGTVATESWPSTEDDPYWTFWGHIHDYDPMPHWKDVVENRNIPTFVAYGELDQQDNVPVVESVERFEKEIHTGPLTVNVYAGTGHSLTDIDIMQKEMRFVFVEPLVRDLTAWVHDNVPGRQ